MTDLASLETAFGSIPESPPEPEPVTPSSGAVTDRYARRLESLLSAEGGTWRRVLAGDHAYPSDSEADSAVVWAMVKRHFTDGEIWDTLGGSHLYAARVAKKGQKHAERLFAKEIRDARREVVPFDEDPGVPEARVSLNGRHHGVPPIPDSLPDPLNRESRNATASA